MKNRSKTTLRGEEEHGQCPFSLRCSQSTAMATRVACAANCYICVPRCLMWTTAGTPPHVVPRTSEPLETRLMKSGIDLQCPSCTRTWKWTPGISYTEFLAACLEDRSSLLSQVFLRWTTHDHTSRRDTTRRKLRFGMLSGSVWYTAFWSFQLSRWFFGLGEDSELLFFVTKACEN